MKLKDILEDYSEYNAVDKEALLKLLEKPKPKSVYDLKIGDVFWLLSFDGSISVNTWDGYDYEDDSIDVGSIFLTKEEAEKEKAYRKCVALLKKYADGYEWQTKRDNYFIYADCGGLDTWEVKVMSDWDTYKYNDIYFSSSEEALKAVEEIGEKRLLVEYFKIPEDEL